MAISGNFVLGNNFEQVKDQLGRMGLTDPRARELALHMNKLTVDQSDCGGENEPVDVTWREFKRK